MGFSPFSNCKSQVAPNNGFKCSSSKICYANCKSRAGKKVTLADGTVKGKKRYTYVCYNKTWKRQYCDGPTSYTSHIIDDIVTEAIHKLFDKLKGSPQDTVFDTYYNHKLNDCKASLAHAKKVYEQDSKELATLEAEVVKALSSCGTFTLGQRQPGMEHRPRCFS